MQPHFARALSAVSTMPLTFRQADIREVANSEFCGPYDFVLSRRFLHYLSYPEAAELVSRIGRHLLPAGRMFVSVSGLVSELGDQYRDRQRRIDDRLAALSPAMAIKHNIREKVCLYKPDEFAHLFEMSGFSVAKMWTSAFGNIQGVFVRVGE